MADQAGQAAGRAVEAAAQPVAELIWGQVQLRITDVWTVRGIAIGAFYLANKALTMLAVRRAVERRNPDNPDQPADPRVGDEVQQGSLLVPVYFYSQLGYQYFTSIQGGPFLMACLQTELEKVGYKGHINVSVEKWELPNLPEGGAGPLMGMMAMGSEEKVQDWLAGLADDGQMTDLSTETGDSGIPKDVSSEATAPEYVATEPSQAQAATQQPELLEGPLEWQITWLLQHTDLHTCTALRLLKAYSCLQRGAAMLTSGEYQEGEGVEHLLEGLAVLEYTRPELITTTLYSTVGLNLDKPRLDQLIQANPNSTPCLLMQALQLPEGHSRPPALTHVIDVVLQHGETDPMYKHLAHMYCTLGISLSVTTWQPVQALSAFASALMYKPDHLFTLYLTAGCSTDVSVPQAIRQFHHYIHTAPTDHLWVPEAHYYLVILYGRQGPSVHRDRILHHYNMAEERERNRLPVFASHQVPRSTKLLAKIVYDRVMGNPIELENVCKTS